MCCSVIQILLHHRILQVIEVCHVIINDNCLSGHQIFLVISMILVSFFQIVRSQGNGMTLLTVEIYLGSFLLLVWYRAEDVNSVRESRAECNELQIAKAVSNTIKIAGV
jgi:hypothetical protein